MTRYLAKVILSLEPSVMRDKYHEVIREISAHNKNDLLKMIGVDPVVFRTNTPSGSVDLQIWVTCISSSSLNRSVLPFYFIGARKYIFMCSSKKPFPFVSETIDLTSEYLNALNEVIILTESDGETKQFAKIKRDFERLFREKGFRHLTFYQWSTSTDLIIFFEKLVNDLIANISQTTGYIPVGFDLETIEKIVKNQGYNITPNHEVVIPKDDVLFKVDLERNAVFVEKSNCETCSNKCKISKKLCVEIADKGFSNIEGLGDLRILSILFAINDGSILNIKGRKQSEDINTQLDELRATWKKKCEKNSKNEKK